MKHCAHTQEIAFPCRLFLMSFRNNIAYCFKNHKKLLNSCLKLALSDRTPKAQVSNWVQRSKICFP